MKNFKMNRKIKNTIVSFILVGTMITGVTTISACSNKNNWDTNNLFTHAIIINDDIATICEIEKWRDYEDGEQLQIQLKDGTIILSSVFDTKLVNISKSNKNIKDIAQKLIGPEGTVLNIDKPLEYVKSK